MNNETVFLSCSFSDCAYINFNGTANIANLTINVADYGIFYQAIKRFNGTIFSTYRKSYQGRKLYDLQSALVYFTVTHIKPPAYLTRT